MDEQLKAYVIGAFDELFPVAYPDLRERQIKTLGRILPKVMRALAKKRTPGLNARQFAILAILDAMAMGHRSVAGVSLNGFYD
jgi:hypothetical protein